RSRRGAGRGTGRPAWQGAFRRHHQVDRAPDVALAELGRILVVLQPALVGALSDDRNRDALRGWLSYLDAVRARKHRDRQLFDDLVARGRVARNCWDLRPEL